MGSRLDDLLEELGGSSSSDEDDDAVSEQQPVRADHRQPQQVSRLPLHIFPLLCQLLQLGTVRKRLTCASKRVAPFADSSAPRSMRS